MNPDWRRVTKSERCPICGKHDWCLLKGMEGDPEVAICSRVKSEKVVGVKGAGWLHKLRNKYGFEDNNREWIPKKPDPPPPNMEPLSNRYQRDLNGKQFGLLVSELGLSVGSLSRLRLGFSLKHQAYTFPMWNEAGQITGIRLRYPDGTKKAIYGSRAGVFVPRDLRDLEWLFIAEGPTDTAALLDLDFSAVGRPSCSGGVPQLIGLVRKWAPKHIVIVSDQDKPGSPAWEGTQTLAKKLVLEANSLRIIVPPFGVKDARKWKNVFGARLEIKQTITTTKPFEYQP